MVESEGTSVSLIAVRDILEKLKPHLNSQLNDELPGEVKTLYKKYTKVLSMFDGDSSSYKILFEMMSDTFPAAHYSRGTLGQKMLGCLEMSNLPADVRACIPGCRDAIAMHDQTECHYTTWARKSGGGLMKFGEGPAGRCLFISKDDKGPVEEEKKILTDNGYQEYKVVTKSGVSAFEPINPAKPAPVTCTTKTGNNNAFAILVVIVVIILFLLMWYHKWGR